jgi:hypothetical protein
MYNINELVGTGGAACWVFSRLFFSIYYSVKDNAFKNASNTWKTQVKAQQAYDNARDYFYEKEISSECEFSTAWSEIHKIASDGNYKVWAGHVLTHSSKQTDNNDGLEMISCEGNDGTLKQGEISGLQKLSWHKNSFLILAGCNTGLGGNRGWNPALSFASSQGVKTLGQAGYAYFSTDWNKHTETTSSSSNMCLWAFKRGKNGAFGNGSRMPGIVY